MTNQDFEQVATMLHDMGFIVTWADLEDEVMLIKMIPVRS